MPFTVRIDAHAADGAGARPAAVAADGRPLVTLDVGDATSGVASVLAQIDGTAVPLDLAGGRASGRPVAELSYGAHTLAWSVVDVAGNRTDGSSSFSVPDTTAPTFGVVRPAEGTSLADGEVLNVVVPIFDAGSGFDPASVALTLDGAPVTTSGRWMASCTASRSPPRRGRAPPVLQVADHAANAARLAWDFKVAVGATRPRAPCPRRPRACDGSGTGRPGRRERPEPRRPAGRRSVPSRRASEPRGPAS